MPLCHRVSQSFALPPATKPVSHLTCPLPPCHHVTTSPRHCITMLVSHLPCPLPPNQSVICLAPCHQTSQSFDLPSTIASPHHHITVLVCHLPCSLPPNQSLICLAPATKPVSHLTCPLPLHHCITASPHHCITASPHHHVTVSPCHCITMPPRHRITASDFPHHMGMNLIG